MACDAAVEGLAARGGRVGVVWLDAHGDLNTPGSSPSGNAWGMPLRMLLDTGAVAAADAALVGARNLDPPEEAFIEEVGLGTGVAGIDEVLARVDAVYVALDCDVLDPREGVTVFMPEPRGLALAEVEGILQHVAGASRLAGLGLSGLAPGAGNVAALTSICRAAGL